MGRGLGTSYASTRLRREPSVLRAVLTPGAKGGRVGSGGGVFSPRARLLTDLSRRRNTPIAGKFHTSPHGSGKSVERLPNGARLRVRSAARRPENILRLIEAFGGDVR